jgi:hypothetical protein
MKIFYVRGRMENADQLLFREFLLRTPGGSVRRSNRTEKRDILHRPFAVQQGAKPRRDMNAWRERRVRYLLETGRVELSE